MPLPPPAASLGRFSRCHRLLPLFLLKVALGPGSKSGPSVVSIEVNGKTYFIGTLDKADDTEIKARAQPPTAATHHSAAAARAAAAAAARTAALASGLNAQLRSITGCCGCETGTVPCAILRCLQYHTLTSPTSPPRLGSALRAAGPRRGRHLHPAPLGPQLRLRHRLHRRARAGGRRGARPRPACSAEGAGSARLSWPRGRGKELPTVSSPPCRRSPPAPPPSFVSRSSRTLTATATTTSRPRRAGLLGPTPAFLHIQEYAARAHAPRRIGQAAVQRSRQSTRPPW